MAEQNGPTNAQSHKQILLLSYTHLLYYTEHQKLTNRSNFDQKRGLSDVKIGRNRSICFAQFKQH